MRRVRVVFDYHMSWPIVVDHVVNRELESVVSERLLAEIRQLVEVWHNDVANGSPLEETDTDPEVLESFNSRVDAMKSALARELGDGFEVI